MSSSHITIGLVFGGRSGEHDVSIRSASTVIRGLRSGHNKERYTVLAIYIDRDGRWWGTDLAEATLASETAPELSPPLPTSGFQGFPEGCDGIDIWYPVLHGPNGEDGTIQGLFQLTGKPFVGAGVLGSAVSMDKQAMKSAFSSAGLSQLPYVALHASELEHANSRSALLHRIETELNYPCFVKPANLGSSVGISKVRSRHELEAGLNQAAALDPRMVVEQGVNAREVECGVLGGRTLEASVVGEVRFDADWYDYETKYTAGRSTILIPAPLPDQVSHRIRAQALQACAAVGVNGMGRVDFFYDEAADQLWINEINTLPGFTTQSMFPMLWAASGVTLEQLVHQLIQTARE